MTITTKDTNVIILYGDGAVSHFSELVNNWCRLIASSQWDSFQFILAGNSKPELKLDDVAKNVVGNRNVRFFNIAGDGEGGDGDPAPDSSTYHNIVFDKVKTGNVRLHIVYDPGGKECSIAWLRDLINAAMSVAVLTTTCMYYLLFGRNSLASEKEPLIELLKTYPGTAFLLGDSNASGGRVTLEDRFQATTLAILMNSAGEISVGPKAYSLGYSALNANGAELRHLSESAACRAIISEISKTVDSLSSELDLQLLPGEAGSVTGLYDWLKKYVVEHIAQPSTTELKNAWITIRMNPDLSPVEAIRRMKRFADLNYTSDENAKGPAKAFAWQEEHRIMQQLRSSVHTATLSDRIFSDIADALHRIASEDVQPSGCAYPKKPFVLFGKASQNETYIQECKSAVIKPIREYIIRKNVCVFAGELEQTYKKLAEWVRTARGNRDTEYRRLTALELLQDIQKELDSAESGNASRLALKYKNYAAELDSIRPKLAVLTEGIIATYYDEKACVNEQSWRNLIRQAGKNLEKKLSPEYRGDFFRVLTSEFSTPEEREQFFDEYLKSGPRMYTHLQAVPSAGMEVLLADDRLTDKWFINKKLYEVKTDNAENLTVYPLGEYAADWYLETDKTVYFLNQATANQAGAVPSHGHDVFESTAEDRPRVTMQFPENDLFGSLDPEKIVLHPVEETASRCPIRLEPDEKNNYRLYWDWCRNDETAMVEIYQFGERVGKVAVIPVKRFKTNGDNMNVTDEVMGGKPLPAGTLTVTIRDASHNVFIDSVEVMGRRDVIRYKANNSKLQLQPEKSGLVEKVVLRTTETDGTQHYYPLYPGDDEKPWLFEGLTISDGKIVEDPLKPTGTIYPVRVD